MKISREELEQMTKNYLKSNEIKYLNKKKNKTLETNDIINIHTYGETIKVL